MSPLGPGRPAHGLRLRFEVGSPRSDWAWTGDCSEQDRPPERHGEVGELLDRYGRKEGDEEISLWVTADRDGLEARWLCVGSCWGEGDETKEALREVVLRRLREAPAGPFPRAFDAAWASRLAVFFGASGLELSAPEIREKVALGHHSLIEDLMWREAVAGILAPVLSRDLDLDDLEARRKAQEEELFANSDGPHTSARLAMVEPAWSRPENPGVVPPTTAPGSYGGRTGG